MIESKGRNPIKTSSYLFLFAILIISLSNLYFNPFAVFLSLDLYSAEPSSQSRGHDTSIIITSNLIPTHPSIDIIHATITSIDQHLIGLPLDTPIFVTIDGLPKTRYLDDPTRREQYIRNLKEANFSPFTNLHVVPMDTHLHLAGSINYTLVHYVETEFVYILQHDLKFCQSPVNHTGLIDAMKEHPDTLYNVRFRKASNLKRTLSSYCAGNSSLDDFQYNGLDFFATSIWSDNNHLTNRKYYLNMLHLLVFLKRAMESPMQNNAAKDCIHWGQQIYGNRKNESQVHICHLDGRLSMPSNTS